MIERTTPTCPLTRAIELLSPGTAVDPFVRDIPYRGWLIAIDQRKHPVGDGKVFRALVHQRCDEDGLNGRGRRLAVSTKRGWRTRLRKEIDEIIDKLESPEVSKVDPAPPVMDLVTIINNVLAARTDEEDQRLRALRTDVTSAEEFNSLLEHLTRQELDLLLGCVYRQEKAANITYTLTNTGSYTRPMLDNDQIEAVQQTMSTYPLIQLLGHLGQALRG